MGTLSLGFSAKNLAAKWRIAAFAAGLMAVACGPALAQSADMEALVAAAQEEGTLSFYSGFTEADNIAAANAFKEKYGIDVQIFRGPTNDVLARFDLELQSGRVNADVIGLGDVFASNDLQKRGVLMEYVPPSTQDGGFDKKFAGTHYNVVSMTVWPSLWNSELVTGENVPTDYPDFLKPFWKGRLGILDASTSLVGLQYYYMVREAMGADFMEKLGAQNFQMVSPNNAIADRIVVGEIYGAPLLILSVAEQFKAMSAPIAVGYMKSGTPVMSRTLQIVDNAPHPNAAKLFVDFLLSKEGQQTFQGVAKGVSPRTDVVTESVPSLSDINALSIDDVEAFVSSQEDLQAEFERFFKAN